MAIVTHKLKDTTQESKASNMIDILNMFDQLQAILVANPINGSLSILVNVTGFEAHQYFYLGKFIIQLENLD